MSDITSIRDTSGFIAVLSSVWLILLALCALIGILIVPVTGNGSNVVVFLIGTFKVAVSLFAIAVWLFGWYRAMNFLLEYEFYRSENSLS